MEMPVEFLTNEELISELLQRESFAGLVLTFDGDLRDYNNSDIANFKLYGRGFPPEESADMLHLILEKLESEELDDEL